MICSDSQAAIRALSSQNRDHCILVEIAEFLYKMSRYDLRCVFVWIPGHSGIAGNVRADYWANKAHDKTTTTYVKVGHREFVPHVRQCTTEYFAKLWHEYRHTLLKVVKRTIGYWSSSVRSSRKEEVLLARMRIGHTILTHKHVIDHQPPPACGLCRCPIDVAHILLDCRKFRRERRHLRAECRASNLLMSLNTLLGDNNPVITDAVFRYLKECQLYNRL